ncbi:hypothetical protein [Variovorax sp. PBS-H4]|uniref:hypothetical protein n=1 Tax=Variovorax sp. PBS-H4 TaxID=434008 RepID=UPI0013A55CAA|nr:hypothetical protein [Variovorax sp. PBS-H4]
MKLKDTLEVISGHELSHGVIVYGLSIRGSQPRTVQLGSDFINRIDVSFLYGEQWEIRVCDIGFTKWPKTNEQWNAIVHQMLSIMLSTGAVIAWLGSEGRPLATPPALFDPKAMEGGILAWATSTESSPVPSLDGPPSSVGNNELDRLRTRFMDLATSD